MAKQEKLKDEASKLEARQFALHEALKEGELAVDAARGRLSRDPCRQARPEIVIEYRKIAKALDQIAEANRRLAAIRAKIEAAGYLATLGSPAMMVPNRNLHSAVAADRG